MTRGSARSPSLQSLLANHGSLSCRCRGAFASNNDAAHGWGRRHGQCLGDCAAVGRRFGVPNPHHIIGQRRGGQIYRPVPAWGDYSAATCLNSHWPSVHICGFRPPEHTASRRVGFVPCHMAGSSGRHLRRWRRGVECSAQCAHGMGSQPYVICRGKATSSCACYFR